MNKNARIGGILNIISGALGLLWGVLIFINLQYAYWWQIVLALGVFEVLLGILSIVGGLVALRQKAWGLALAGAIAGLFTFFPTAIAAIILLSIGRKSFRHTAQIPA